MAENLRVILTQLRQNRKVVENLIRLPFRVKNMATSRSGGEVGRLGESFSADLSSVRLWFENCQDNIVERRKLFKRRALMAIRDHDYLRKKCDAWKNAVTSNLIECESKHAAEFRQAFERWLQLAEFLIEKWDEFEKVNIHPTSWLRHRRDDVRRLICNWKTPTASMPVGVASFLATLTEGRSAEELNRLSVLSEAAVQASDLRSDVDTDEWAEELAKDLARFKD